MSDSSKDLVKNYNKTVLGGQYEEYPRSIGLFLIPEYPEDEVDRGMWSSALDAILTTLRYLAPATLLTLFWGQQSFLFKLLKHIDSAFRAIVFSSEEQKQAVLKWLAEAGPAQIEHLDTVWRHGWILCGVLDAAMPGACAGHPPTRLSLKHAQAIADHYLGVEPVFSRQELETSDSLSKHQEWKLATYLDRIRQALTKITPPVSKPTSQRTSPETTQFTLDYVAKGSGLTAAQVRNKMYFKVYPTSQQSLDPGEVTILIRGPKDTYGMSVLPPILGKAQMIRQKLLGLQSNPNYTENALPITQGATYLRSYGKNDMSKTYHIPKAKYDIEIEVDMRSDHAKIGYTVHIDGKYEISITSRGHNIVGSPFTMTATKNIIRILENDSFCLEDGEEIDIVDVKTDRKVVLRIVDFVTEKMLLRENGSLEKITDDEAKTLMSTDNLNDIHGFDTRTTNITTTNDGGIIKVECSKFNTLASKVMTMNRISKIFNDIIAEKKLATAKEKAHINSRTQLTIPDIVNSTFNDSKTNPFLKDKRDKFIIPENISVSLRMEKPTSFYEERVNDTVIETKNPELNTTTEESESDSQDSLEEYVTIEEQINKMVMDRAKSSSNPFLNDTFEQNFVMEKDLGSFVKTEYETNNSQNEETENTSIKIIVEPNESETSSPINTNPFIDPDIINMERPKTPVLKIITGEVKNREDSVYVDPKAELISEELLGNEFLNPFYIHHHQPSQNVERLPITDFIIGAPVSLPPIIRATTPEPDMESMLITAGNKTTDVYGIKEREKQQDNSRSNDVSPSVFSTPIHTNLNKLNESNKLDTNCSSISSTFHSLDSNLTDAVEILSLSNDNQNVPYQEALSSDRDVTPKKDMWDSAYVSIDDSNSSPDSNNNDNTPLCEIHSKHKFSPSDVDIELSKMGPAEREIWQMELVDEVPKTQEEVKANKWELKRPIFTPIIEESDRSISSVMKDIKNTGLVKTENDPVTVAFAELNDVYHEYFSNSECSSTAQTIEQKDSVDSASAVSDVKRHEKDLEGKISEVQPNVTESVSVSQTLHENEPEQPHQNPVYDQNETQFGDSKQNNIVLERKQYWDEKIRQIEANTEENKILLKKRRLSSKQLRHNDSLSKRRGKQIVKKYLSLGYQQDSTNIKPTVSKEIETVNKKGSQSSIGQVQTDTTLVKKWKNFWDNKLETEKDETDLTCFRAKSPKKQERALSPNKLKQSKENISEIKRSQELIDITSKPVKQELPEEVFKAFETSPKRFFGTSRKQILNKIDTFLGKPSTADESSADVSGASHHETGLVSSRISLFHNISQTEDLSLTRRKCQSMHNIFQRKDSEKSITFDDKAISRKPVKIVEGLKYENMNTRDTKDRNFNERKEIDKFATTEREPVAMSLKDKRARMVQKMYNKTFDEAILKKPLVEQDQQKTSVKKSITDFSKHSQHQRYKPINVLQKSSMSKSEMDIFNKTTSKTIDYNLDKHKSCEELPKINVKTFITLYESVSKTDAKAKPVKKIGSTNSVGLQKTSSFSSSSGAVNKITTSHFPSKFSSPASQIKEQKTSVSEANSELAQSPIYWKNESQESRRSSILEPKSLDSIDIEIVSAQDVPKETTYLSLSDIELEIIERPASSTHTTPEKEGTNAHIDYKSRFKMAKQFFQSLEEITDEKKPAKLNECEILLLNKHNESLENDRPKKRTKKNIKSHSMPSSEISKIWTQLQESQEASSSKLVKISEKFNVEDLFNDVVEGRLSRQGSLRGIPHKKAVLEAFRSMENLADSKLNSYEIAVSQLNDFAKENKVKNAQTYLTEYPYLPTTDPSKYHSRLDAKATGLISLKELLNSKPRRNSVPDIRLNTKFTVDL